MDKVSIYLFILNPIVMLVGGFLVARQSRALENVPFYSKMYVERRLLVSIGMGLIMSLCLNLLTGIADGFDAQLLLRFVGVFVLSTVCYHIGFTFGWGKPLPDASESANSPSKTHSEPFPDSLIVEDLGDAVRITVTTKKRWLFFVTEASRLIFLGLCGLPILGLLAIAFLQKYIPRNVQFLPWLLIGSLALYLLYKKSGDALEYIFDKEVIEINDRFVRIEQYGSRFSRKEECPAEKIKKITTPFSLFGTNKPTRRSRYVNSNAPAFMIWLNRGLSRVHTFGRAIDPADAHRILETIYAKFPQYKG